MKCKTCGKKLTAEEANGIGECDACLNASEAASLDAHHAAAMGPSKPGTTGWIPSKVHVCHYCHELTAMAPVIDYAKHCFWPACCFTCTEAGKPAPLRSAEDEKDAGRTREQEARRAMALLPKVLMAVGVMRGPLTRKEILAAADDWIGGKPDRGADRITIERMRQLDVEGWIPEHDDKHDRGELALAAIHYACPPGMEVEKRQLVREVGAHGHVRAHHVQSQVWPWEPAGDKKEKRSRIRQLTIAGALIAAEIDRLLRAGEKP